MSSPRIYQNRENAQNIYQDKYILAKSREKLESIDHNRMST